MEEVYQGFWVDWSDGRALGTTLTLSTQRGTYLIACLAIFVQLVGGSCWSAIAKAMFVLKASREFKVILRNDTSPGGAFADLLKLLRLQRTKSSRNTNRSKKSAPASLSKASHNKHSGKGLILATLVLALVNIIGFLVAGVFSSKVAVTQSKALLQSSRCGIWQGWGARNGSRIKPATDAQWEIEKAFHFGRDSMNFQRSSSHVTTCRGKSANACLPLGPRWVNVTITAGTPCPFDTRLCRGNETVTFNTGRIDSHFDMGINTPARDRLTLQMILRCSPIETEGYSKFYDSANISQLMDIDHIQNLLVGATATSVGDKLKLTLLCYRVLSHFTILDSLPSSTAISQL